MTILYLMTIIPHNNQNSWQYHTSWQSYLTTIITHDNIIPHEILPHNNHNSWQYYTSWQSYLTTIITHSNLPQDNYTSQQSQLMTILYLMTIIPHNNNNSWQYYTSQQSYLTTIITHDNIIPGDNHTSQQFKTHDNNTSWQS
jgi:hypothetical protein